MLSNVLLWKYQITILIVKYQIITNDCINTCQMTHSECLFVAVQDRVKQILLYHMLTEPLVFYDQIHLYAKKSRTRKIPKYDKEI